MNRKHRTAYTLEGNQETYQVYDSEGKMLMFFKIENISFSKLYTAYYVDSNIDFDFINDPMINYCISKIKYRTLEDKGIEVYLNKIIERILLNERGQKMFIDSYFLNDRGKFLPCLYNVYKEIINNFDFENCVQLAVPYSIRTDIILMNMINTPKVYERLISKADSITKEIFEDNIPNERVGLVYIDLYCSAAIFYKIRDEGDNKTSFTMIVENKIVMFFELIIKIDSY